MRLSQLLVASFATSLMMNSAVSAQDTRLEQSRKNLQQIALAFHNYHQAHGQLPSYANFDDDGQPLLSWRVHLLPFMGREAIALHSDFHLDERWDSPHNRELISKMPNAYSVPLETSLDAGHTCYVVPHSIRSLFRPNRDGHDTQIEFREIYQGLPNIILAVEADRSVATQWTQPNDLQFDGSRPLAHLGTLRKSGFLVSWASGIISFVPNDFGKRHPDRDEFLRGLFEEVQGRGVAYYFQLE